jgi:hypothetical protein
MISLSTDQDPVDGFIANLEKELRLRKQELSNVWFLTWEQDNDIKKTSLLRNNTLILYAHWEGFIKSSSIKYLDYVCKRNITCRSLTLNFKALHIQRINNKTINNSEWSRLLDIANENFDDAFNVKADAVIDTESNLNSKVLSKITSTLNILDFDLEDKLIKLIDKGLLSDRNAIAHGQLKNVPFSRVEQYHSNILCLLEQYKDAVINMVVNECYLASSNNVL